MMTSWYGNDLAVSGKSIGLIGPVMRAFDISLDVILNTVLDIHSNRRRFERQWSRRYVNSKNSKNIDQY